MNTTRLLALAACALASCFSPKSMSNATISPEHVAWIVETTPQVGPWVSSLECEEAWVDAYRDGTDHLVLVARSPDWSRNVVLSCEDQTSVAVPKEQRAGLATTLSRYSRSVRANAWFGPPQPLVDAIVFGGSLFLYPWCQPVLPGSLPRFEATKEPARIRTALPDADTLTIYVSFEDPATNSFWVAAYRGDLHLRSQAREE